MRIAETVINNKITYTVEGMSYMKKDVSSFIADLEKYENFTNVSLESIKPAPLDIKRRVCIFFESRAQIVCASGRNAE